MKTRLVRFLTTLTLCASLHQAAAQGTAFTYQGQLFNGTNPANGSYDMKLLLFNSLTGGSQLGSTITNTGVGVINGLFIMTVDFGPVFTGSSNWLQIDVRTNGGSTFTQLNPRQQLTPTPYAVFAESANAAGLSGAIPNGGLSGTYTGAITLNNPANNLDGNGSGLTGLNASQLTSGTVPDAKLSGNVALLNASQTFIGTNIFAGANQGLIVNGGPVGTNLFTGLGFQFNNGTHEGSIIAGFNDDYANLNFYTKIGPGSPVLKQVKIDRYGVVMIDQQDDNNGVLNDGTTNGVGLTFGGNSGEGIASQRTAGVNQYGLDFYTGHNHQMSILHNGNIGMGTTNPSTALQVVGTVTATSFSGNGGSLTSLNANNLSSGVVPLSQLPATVSLLSEPGSANFFAGLLAGNATVSGIRNSGFGNGALTADTSGFENTADGYDALNSNKAGSDNTAMGAFALGDTVNASQNTAVGAGALSAATTGSNNVAVGYQALEENRSDVGIVAIGYQALQNDAFTPGFFGSSASVAIGYQALQANTTGAFNTAIGYQALYHNTNGIENTATGLNALFANTSGNENTATGIAALEGNTTGVQNTATGVAALQSNTTGSNNVAMGVSAMANSTADTGIVAIGYQALQNDAFTPGFFGSSASVAIGYQALQANTTGGFNTAIGYQALYQNASGIDNIGIGIGAGQNLTSGNYNIDLGNSGVNGDNGVIRIGTPGTHANTYLAGDVGMNGALEIDQTGTYGLNSGTVSSNALTFGTGPGGSGEGIASQRTSGPNQFDLALYTGFIARLTILSSGNVGIGTASPQNTLDVNGTTRTHSIIITGGSDLAEPFPIANADQLVADGAVVVIDEANPGQLKLTDQPYDTHVAGVVSGANGIHPGIQMQQEGLLEGGRNVALTGRVYVQADASNGAIKPGDLLTTSRTPGRAMKVTDHLKAQGAILGKAMTGLTDGQGMVLVLVTLQ